MFGLSRRWNESLSSAITTSLEVLRKYVIFKPKSLFSPLKSHFNRNLPPRNEDTFYMYALDSVSWYNPLLQTVRCIQALFAGTLRERESRALDHLEELDIYNK